MSKVIDWKDVKITLGGKEVLPLSSIRIGEKIEGDGVDLPTIKYTATLEITKSDYEALAAFADDNNN